MATGLQPSLAALILAQTVDAVIYADTEGVILLWNAAAEQLFGFVSEEAVGASLDLIIPERLRRAHWDAFVRSMETGLTKYTDRVLTTRSMRKDGGRLYVDLGFGLVKDANGTPIGAFATGRDCTARYEAERALKARVQELESQAAAAPRLS